MKLTTMVNAHCLLVETSYCTYFFFLKKMTFPCTICFNTFQKWTKEKMYATKKEKYSQPQEFRER